MIHINVSHVPYSCSNAQCLGKCQCTLFMSTNRQNQLTSICRLFSIHTAVNRLTSDHYNKPDKRYAVLESLKEQGCLLEMHR